MPITLTKTIPDPTAQTAHIKITRWPDGRRTVQVEYSNQGNDFFANLDAVADPQTGASADFTAQELTKLDAFVANVLTKAKTQMGF